MSTSIVPAVIESRIFFIRGQKVMVDRDLAQLYEVTTKVLIKLSKEIEIDFQISLCSSMDWKFFVPFYYLLNNFLKIIA